MISADAEKIRDECVKEFETRAASVKGPLKELWQSVATESCDRRLHLSTPELQREMCVWLPERQAAAVKLLVSRSKRREWRLRACVRGGTSRSSFYRGRSAVKPSAPNHE
eukprot:6682846-Prymnesium_polylepis.2